MLKLPNVSRKLDCLVLKMTMDSRVSDLLKRSSLIKSACNQLQTSSKFALLLESVLMLGNVLNNADEEANRIKVVKGISFDSFAALSGTKGYDKKTSLLVYLEKILSVKLPDVFSVYDELTDLSAAAHESFDGIRQEEDDLSKQLKAVTDELKSSQNLLDSGRLIGEEKKDVEDSIHELEEFASTAQSTISKLHGTVEDARESFSGLLAYFCQEPKQKSEDFFNYVIVFLDELMKCHKQQEEKRERIQNKKKKEEELRAMKKKEDIAPNTALSSLFDQLTTK